MYYKIIDKCILCIINKFDKKALLRLIKKN